MATPVTTPLPEPTVASDGLLLTQLPPVVASVSVVVKPRHMMPLPLMATGVALTVTGVVVKQPVANW
jgi:hypothetical protein